jgi:thiosulfate dehydrogenase
MSRIQSISQWIILPVAIFILILIVGTGEGGVTSLGTTTESDVVPAGENVRAIPMCDGQTKLLVEIDDVPRGEKMPEGIARDVAEQLLDQYRELKDENGEILLAHGKEHSKREMMIWETEMKRAVDEGYKVFHSPDLGTNGVSCDMCHPDASNTHPETYPKFQTQLKKVVLLRDMINWCIENPLEGVPLSDDDPKLKAMEAYILWARKGVPLDSGKH